MISKHSAHSTSLPVGFHIWLWRYTCLLLLISMLRQAIFKSKGDKLSSSAECRYRTQGLIHLSASRLNACWCPWDWRRRSVNIGAGLVCRNRLHLNNVNRDRPAKDPLGSVQVLGLGWFGWGKTLLDSAVEFWQSLGFQFSAKVSFSPFFCFQFKQNGQM